MTMDGQWLDLGALDEMPEGRPVLRKVEGRRFACVRRGDAAFAIDDRCPHQGYPLSQGSCKDGVLTCEWHNWKFDLRSGECLFGGEAVRHYPTRVVDGRVHLSTAIDAEKEVARLRIGIEKAIARDDMGRALREALRLGEMVAHPRAATLGTIAVGFEACAQDGARRAEYGFDHGLAALADFMSWAERGWIGKEEAFVAGAHGVAEPSRHLGARAVPAPEMAGEDPLDPKRIAEALIAERREEAEARARAITREHGAARAVASLLPFVARHLYDYGHGAIFLAKALEIAERFPAIAEDVIGAMTVTLAWGTAETALPPFTATRAALSRVDAIVVSGESASDLGESDRAAYEAAVLSGEAAAVEATVSWLARGVDPKALLTAIAHAAAERIRRFDVAWERRTDAEVGVLDVTHTFTFAESALSLAAHATARDVARLAVLGAGFVGKVRAGDRADLSDPLPSTGAVDLGAALAARDVGSAVAIARRMSADERRAAYVTIAPFAAFDAATRPIFYAHTVKNTEAFHRMDRADPRADATYLVALLMFVAQARSEVRHRRVAAVARKFLADGRPPEGLY